MSAETQRILAELDRIDADRAMTLHPAHASVTEVLKTRLKIPEQEAGAHATMVLGVLTFQGFVTWPRAPFVEKPPHG